MNISTEEKKLEAIKRMKALKIFPGVIKHFKREGLVSLSHSPLGTHFWLLDDESKKIVARFEKENDALVYTGIRSYTEIGIMDSFLFVSDYREDWEMDWQNFGSNIVFAYVYNHDNPDLSEMGSIGIVHTSTAGLKRIW